MSLTQEDLQQIRSIVYEVVHTEVSSIVDDKLQPLQAELLALRSDIKEIYDMIAKLQSNTTTDQNFSSKTLEEKLLILNSELLAAAKQAGIALPRS